MKTIFLIEIIILHCLITTLSAESIPFRMLGKLIMVEAKINDNKGYFILDTGIEELVLNEKYFAGFRSYSEFSGVNGSIVRSSDTEVKFGFGEHNWDKIGALVTPLNTIEDLRGTPIAGLLGTDLFENFRLVIDFDKREIHLSRDDANSESLTEDEPWGQSFIYKGNRPEIKAQIGEVRLRLLLDTGSEMNVLRKSLIKKIQENVVRTDTKRLVGLGSSGLEVPVFQVSNMVAGTLSCQPMKIYFLFNPCQELFYDGLLGYEFLCQFKITIDFRRKMIFLSPSRDHPDTFDGLVKADTIKTEKGQIVK